MISLGIQSVGIRKCGRCNTRITEQNDSGWEIFVEDSNLIQPICKNCDYGTTNIILEGEVVQTDKLDNRWVTEIDMKDRFGAYITFTLSLPYNVEPGTKVNMVLKNEN